MQKYIRILILRKNNVFNSLNTLCVNHSSGRKGEAMMFIYLPFAIFNRVYLDLTQIDP